MIRPITKSEIKKALPVALQKRARIIDRYGDDNGKRLTDKYLFSLIEEVIYFNRTEERIYERTD